MSRRRLIIIVSAVVVLLLGTAVLLIVSQDSQDRGGPTSTPEATPSATPTPAFSFQEDPHEGAGAAQQAEGKDNPVLTELPENNRFWSLTFGGSRENKYVLDATVYYVEGKEDPKKKMAQQRPFILRFLRDIGQPDGTYILKLTPSPVNDSYNLS